MNKRKCKECNKEMELWYLLEDYEEWFCNNCYTYKEYKGGKLVKELNLEGAKDIKVE